MRFRLHTSPGRRQTVGEMLYDIAQTQVAEMGLPSKGIGLWFPYVASLMIFIWTINMLGLPAAAAHRARPTTACRCGGSTRRPRRCRCASRSRFMTWIFTHVEGIRWNGPWQYVRSWIPEVPKPILPMIIVIEVLSQFMRLISLSVRLYANMLAGHILILTFIGLIFIFESLLAVPLVGIAAVFYVFEVVIVVSIQAFIFAALSAIYIGSAIEPEH